MGKPLEPSPVRRPIQGTRGGHTLGALPLMKARLGAERGNLAPQVAGRRLINMAHRAGCPCCKKSADEMPGGETDEHRLIECEAFAEARRQTGLQAIIDELKETELIKAFPPDSQLTAMYILLTGGHVTTPQSLVRANTQAAQVRIATWGDGGVYWKAAHFLARIHKPHRTIIDALRKEYKEARHAAREQQCQQCGDADCDQKERAMLLCDGKGGTCNKSYHIGCLKPPLSAIPPAEDDWLCPECTEAEAQASNADGRDPHNNPQPDRPPPRAAPRAPHPPPPPVRPVLGLRLGPHPLLPLALPQAPPSPPPLQPEPLQVRSGQVRYITRPKSEAMRVTRQLRLPPRNRRA